MARPLAIALFVGLFCAMAMTAAAAPSPDGNWKTISDTDGKPRGLIRVQTVGGVLQGVAVASLRGEDPHRVCNKCSGDRHGKPIIGMQVIWGLRQDPNNPLRYTGGSILDPDNGNVYGAEVTESPDGRSLTVHGFMGVSFLGRTQTWLRAP